MGSLLMPLLGSVAAKAGDALLRELMRVWGLDKARRKLERHLTAIQCILLDADAKSHTNPVVRRWITDLKTAAYQADDVLDAFCYEALRCHAARIRPHSTAHKIRSYFTMNSPVVFRLSMSRRMKEALEMIDELVAEMNSFQFLQHTEAPRFDHPQTHSCVEESEIVARQDEKEQVVKILLEHSHNSNDNNNNNNVMVLPIVGLGGIGKTTLAQLVHNDERVVHHFELVLWVCVSNRFVIEEIIRSIIEVATLNKCDLTQMEALQKRLSGVLGKKRYLLVLDDVWNEDNHKWDNMRSLLCSHASSGSAIIVTSRSNQVASIMGTLPPHHMSPLNEDQSWGLFWRNAFGREEKTQEEFISMANSIVHKCKRLPLAIKAVAALLRSKHHSQWFSILSSDVWKNDILPNGIVPALQLSYDHLSSEAKMCFSLCAIFPKNNTMDRDMLVQLWMANDFIESETEGQHIFDVLVWRCFLQDVEIQKKNFIRQTTCKMHDLMHDLADSVSGNDYSIMEESSSCREILEGSIDASSVQHDARHLSLDYVSNNTISVMKKFLAPRPRTILVQREWKGSGTPLSISKSKFMSLRALKTRSINTHMTNLKHLRYLDCSESRISALPESTSILYRLQTLKLNYCTNLEKLPDGMMYMSSLRHIFLDGCDGLRRMPKGIGQLNSLHTLTSYVIDSGAGRGIDQLKDLNLGGHLSLTELRKVHNAENAKQGNMPAKQNLKRISLNWYGPYSTHVGCDYEMDTNAEVILEALHPHKTLEVFLLSNYTGAILPSWMHNSTLLEHLGELSLSSCKNCKNLPPLWQLPSLRYLSLKGLYSLTSICAGNDDMDIGEPCISTPLSFPKLETMIFSNMPNLERWYHEVAEQVADVSFPQLKKLSISECAMLANMPKVLPLLEDLWVQRPTDISLYHLMNLYVQTNLEFRGSIEVVPTVGWRPVNLHFSRHGECNVSLKLTENVERFGEDLRRIPCRSIKKLDIVDCDCLFSSQPSQIQQNIWNHFGFVEILDISGSNGAVQWPAVELRNLKSLQHLRFDRCSKLTGSLPSTISDGENSLLQLQHLSFFLCNNLVEIPKLPATLETLHIARCPKLVSMPTILGNNKGLRELNVIECDALATFPDRMYGVTMLKKLRLKRCPRVETLPEGLLQQLPALEELSITDCPYLEGAFSRRGAYWDLVEAIPKRSVGPQD